MIQLYQQIHVDHAKIRKTHKHLGKCIQFDSDGYFLQCKNIQSKIYIMYKKRRMSLLLYHFYHLILFIWFSCSILTPKHYCLSFLLYIFSLSIFKIFHLFLFLNSCKIKIFKNLCAIYCNIKMAHMYRVSGSFVAITSKMSQNLS